MLPGRGGIRTAVSCTLWVAFLWGLYLMLGRDRLHSAEVHAAMSSTVLSDNEMAIEELHFAISLSYMTYGS